jgi:hypothetical protein
MNMELENMNGAVELSMDELALVNGGSIWSVIKDGVNWVVDHGSDIKKGVDAVKKVVDWFRKTF